jgi:hypothetical protein
VLGHHLVPQLTYGPSPGFKMPAPHVGAPDDEVVVSFVLGNFQYQVGIRQGRAG